MAKTCEQFRIKADKIFDRLQWEEGLKYQTFTIYTSNS